VSSYPFLIHIRLKLILQWEFCHTKDLEDSEEKSIGG